MSGKNSTTLEDQFASFDPNNPESLAALENAAFGGSEVPAAEADQADVEGKEEKPATAADTPKQDEKKDDPAPAAAKDEKSDGATSGVNDQAGVQAKDGRHIIPYSVLERERQARIQAEATAHAQAELIKQLQAGTATKEDVKAAQLTDEELQAIDNDLPGVAKALRAQQDMIRDLVGTIQTLKQGQEVQQKSAEQVRMDEEEAAIAANANLSALRESVESDPKAAARWNRVVSTYQSMRDDPEFFHLDTAALINKADAAVTAIYGPQMQTQAPAPAAEPKKEPQQDLKQAADAALKAQPAAVPTTLSDIPGGAAPAQSDIETLENVSAAALGNLAIQDPARFESMLLRSGIKLQ